MCDAVATRRRHGDVRQHDARLLVLAVPAVFHDDVDDETDDNRGEDRAVERDDVGLGVGSVVGGPHCRHGAR